MKTETSERRRTLLWALPASLILHALIAAFLVYGLPIPAQQPQEEQPINVALVPPPEPPKPKPEPPPPPKKPEAQTPPEQKVEKPPASSKVEGLRPVFQFSDKDTGPRKSLDGSSAQDTAPSPDKDDASKPPVVPKEAESKPAASPDSADSAKVDEKPATATKDTEPTQEKQETEDKQEAGAEDGDKQAAAAVPPLAAPDGGEIELPTSAQPPKPRPENTRKTSPAKVSTSVSGNASRPSSTNVAAAQAYSGLPGVRRLHSQGATGYALATTAIDGLPRDERAGQLCFSVLGQELKDGSYDPYLWPVYELKEGNVIAQPHAHFRTRTTWYDLSFRCVIDANATQVVSFAFRVGAPNSPEESARLDQEARR
jgi:hypothetical protein